MDVDDRHVYANLFRPGNGRGRDVYLFKKRASLKGKKLNFVLPGLEGPNISIFRLLSFTQGGKKFFKRAHCYTGLYFSPIGDLPNSNLGWWALKYTFYFLITIERAIFFYEGRDI